MYKIEDLQFILQECLQTGGDFSEIFLEDKFTNSIEKNKSEIRTCQTNHIYGAGIRILLGDEEVYGYTNDTSRAGLVALAQKLRSSFKEPKKDITVALVKESYETLVEAKEYSKDVSNAIKLQYLDTVSSAAVESSSSLVQVITYFIDDTQKVVIANSENKLVEDIRNHQRIFCIAVASDGTKMEQAVASYGFNAGIEKFDEYDLALLGKNCGLTAEAMLSAIEITGGKYDVVIHNAFGGVIFHEACGHGLEATSVAKGLSVFANKIGERIANPCVTAIDDGTIPNKWGSITVDDEGTPSKRNVLIKDGILQGYMVDSRNGRKMKTKSTGSARRQSYRFSPTSRMTNTFIDNGTSTFEEIISSVKYGLFAKAMGGGSVNPTTGEYNFSVSEGYLIEDGKITKMVKGATLIGSGADTLRKIEMVGNNLLMSEGMCGSVSGAVHTSVGQPTILVRDMAVGGKGGNQ